MPFHSYSEILSGQNPKFLLSNLMDMFLFVPAGLLVSILFPNCRFKGYSRCSDLTLGDFWGVWDIAPEMDDNKGTSVVLVQSARGERLLSEISGQLVLRDVTLEEASRQNQAMLCCAQANPHREEALANVRAGNWQVLSRWLAPQKPSLLRRVRSLAGRILRKLKFIK